jgi:hypothetical protein
MNFIKKLLGFEKIEANIEIANKLLEEATAKKDEAEQALKLFKTKKSWLN